MLCIVIKNINENHDQNLTQFQISETHRRKGGESKLRRNRSAITLLTYLLRKGLTLHNSSHNIHQNEL